ncbi:MAG: hypothetical protein RLZZ453_1155 [Chlamydiota bacterium]|jgi:sulfite reductase (NADPH) flavoprotein alpha-component
MSTKIDRLNPLRATLKERFRLTGPGSTKETFHLVLNTKGSSLEFKVGDAVGIYPKNDPLLVDHILDVLQAKGDEMIKDPRSSTEYTIREFLSSKANLARITSSFLKLFYQYETSGSRKETLKYLLDADNKPTLSAYLAEHDPLDLFKEYRGNAAPLQAVCNQFGPLLPRFYSIASSPLVYSGELHLTVALFTFSHQGEQRYGVASHFLCSLAELNTTPIPLYIQPNPHFTLPQDPSVPIILIGPGTGIAPFRAFIQERIYKGAKGKMWLFFGERHRATDYFYEKEWNTYSTQAPLKVDVAFSRDQQEKLYVQHLMLKQSATFWKWLEEGAIVYVCGDAEKMAKDVDAALHAIIVKEGGMPPEQAHAYVKQMRLDKRYLADVY